MPRKRVRSKPKPVPEITDEQVADLRSTLLGTCINIYHLCRQRFSIDVDDEFFDRVKKLAKVFRCEQCSEWLDVEADEDRAISGWCTGCVDKIDNPELR